MELLSQGLREAATQLSFYEGLAVILAVAYLLLAIRESLWCWLCAFVSTGIYTVLFWRVNLLMESALNVFYLAMAVYGWWQWRNGGPRHQGVAIHRWPLGVHMKVILAVGVMTMISGYFLVEHTGAARPYVDSFTTWGSVVTTWMVAKKLIENWLYWIVIDAVSALLYLDRGLYLTALLFAVYVVMVIFGYRAWRKHERFAAQAAC